MRLRLNLCALLALAAPLHSAMQWNGVNIDALNGAHKMSINGSGVATYPRMTATLSGTDGNNVSSYTVTSAYNVGSAPTTSILRVLPPSAPGPVAHKFILVLPVKALADFSFGDGLNETRLINYHNILNAHILAPAFPTEPWMGDNISDPNHRYESFLIDIVKWAKLNFSTIGGREEVSVISFSKGGYSVIHAVLRNPGTINNGAAFDSPTAQTWSYMTTTFGWDAQLAYGTQPHWSANYDPVANISAWARYPFLTEARLWHGYSSSAAFAADCAAYHTALTTAGILHVDESALFAAHTWTSGWMDNAYDAIYLMSDTYAPVLQTIATNATGTLITFTYDEPITAGASGSLAGLTVSMTGGAMTLSYFGGGGTNAITYSPSRTILTGQTGTATYVQPGNGLEDRKGNDAPSFSGITVVNNVAGITELDAGAQRLISNTTTGAQDSKALAYAGTILSGSMLVVGGSIWTTGGTTVAPTVTASLAGTTFTVVFPASSPAGVNWRTFLAYGVAGGTGACTITVNPAGASSDFCFGIDAFIGVTQLDVDGGATTSPGAVGPAQDNITTVAANTLILAICSKEVATAMTPLTNYTQIAESESGVNNQPINFQFRIVSSAATYTPGITFGGAGDMWMCQTLSLKP